MVAVCDAVFVVRAQPGRTQIYGWIIVHETREGVFQERQTLSIFVQDLEVCGGLVGDATVTQARLRCFSLLATISAILSISCTSPQLGGLRAFGQRSVHQLYDAL